MKDFPTENADVNGAGEEAVGGTAAAQLRRNIELLPLERLTAYKGNARTHTKKQIRQIVESIRRFGFNSPVLIDDAGEIIAGHGRVEAAKLLGLDGVPTLRLSHLSGAEKRAYVVADNKLAEKAGWDHELLAVELQGLIDLDFDVELTGFEAPEIDFILEDADMAKAEASGPEDRIPDPSPAASITRPGDVWVLGHHRVLCGSALDGSDYERLLQGEKAEFVITDPLCSARIDGNVSGKGGIHHRALPLASGEITKAGLIDFLSTSLRHLAAHSRDGSIHDIFMDWRHVAEIMAAGGAAYTELKNVCVWTKTKSGLGSFYHSRHEWVFIWKSGTAAHINNIGLGKDRRNRSNVWEYPGISPMRAGRLEELAIHSTVKPVALVADAIKDCSRRNGLVLDPFLGSGTTVIAAERTGRRARGIEIDPAYVDVTVKRWQDYSGKTATLAGTARTFQEVADERGDVKSACQVANQAPAPTIREAA